jgi:seryl-tRNA synthetase
MILQIAASKQLLQSKRPSDSSIAPHESSSEVAASAETRRRREPTARTTIKKPRAITDKEWQDIAAKLAEVDTLRATTQQLTARIASLETTISTLLHAMPNQPASSSKP